MADADSAIREKIAKLEHAAQLVMVNSFFLYSSDSLIFALYDVCTVFV